MGNENEVIMLGEERVKLKLTSGNSLTLDGILHALNVRKNLTNVSLLMS